MIDERWRSFAPGFRYDQFKGFSLSGSNKAKSGRRTRLIMPSILVVYDSLHGGP